MILNYCKIWVSREKWTRKFHLLDTEIAINETDVAVIYFVVSENAKIYEIG